MKDKCWAQKVWNWCMRWGQVQDKFWVECVQMPKNRWSWRMESGQGNCCSSSMCQARGSAPAAEISWLKNWTLSAANRHLSGWQGMSCWQRRLKRRQSWSLLEAWFSWPHVSQQNIQRWRAGRQGSCPSFTVKTVWCWASQRASWLTPINQRVWWWRLLFTRASKFVYNTTFYYSPIIYI